MTENVPSAGSSAPAWRIAMPSFVFMIGLLVTALVSTFVEQERRREQMDAVGRLG